MEIHNGLCAHLLILSEDADEPMSRLAKIDQHERYDQEMNALTFSTRKERRKKGGMGKFKRKFLTRLIIKCSHLIKIDSALSSNLISGQKEKENALTENRTQR